MTSEDAPEETPAQAARRRTLYGRRKGKKLRPGQEEILERTLRERAIQPPDFGQVAGAYGISHRRVTKPEEIAPALQEAIDHPGAILLEFVCDPSEVILPMIPSGGRHTDIMVE